MLNKLNSNNNYKVMQQDNKNDKPNSELKGALVYSVPVLETANKEFYRPISLIPEEGGMGANIDIERMHQSKYNSSHSAEFP